MIKRYYPSQNIKDIVDDALKTIIKYSDKYSDEFDIEGLTSTFMNSKLSLEIIDSKFRVNVDFNIPDLVFNDSMSEYANKVYSLISDKDLLSEPDSNITGTIKHSDGTVLYTIDIEYDGTVYWLAKDERRRERSMTKSEYDSEMDKLQDLISDENNIPELELLRSYLRDITKSVEDVWDRINTYTGSDDLKDVLDLVNKLRDKVGTHTNTFKKICVSKVEKEK